MRLIAIASALAFLVLTDAATGEAEAQNRGRWCQLDRNWNVVNCSFRTFRQCQATVSGMGGVCQRNARAQPGRDRGR